MMKTLLRFGLILVLAAFVADLPNAHACKPKKTPPLSGEPYPPEAGEVAYGIALRGNGEYCSSAGTADEPSGCLITCGGGSCQKPYQKEQCGEPVTYRCMPN